MITTLFRNSEFTLRNVRWVDIYLFTGRTMWPNNTTIVSFVIRSYFSRKRRGKARRFCETEKRSHGIVLFPFMFWAMSDEENSHGNASECATIDNSEIFTNGNAWKWTDFVFDISQQRIFGTIAKFYLIFVR